MMRAVPLLTVCLAVFPPMATASQDTRSHEPGVIVRLYDIGVGVHYIPELAPDQLPNVVKVLPTVKLTAEEFAPLEERFMTEVIGNLKIDQPGAYDFRLISDDGSRFWVDGQLVVDHDGLHGAEPKDGQIELPAGWHTLRILHFENGGDEHLELRWRQPGAADGEFTLIPSGVLAHDAGVSRGTSPGVKKTIPPLRRGRPGDGTPVAGVHPSYRLRDMGTGRYPGIERASLAGLPYSDLAILGSAASELPAGSFVWLPPSSADTRQPSVAPFRAGPHRGQCLASDAGLSLCRLFVDQVGEDYQGAFLRFSRCTEPVGPLEMLPKGQLCMPVGVMQKYRYDHLLVALDRITFEMLAVRAMTNGFEIEFTKPLDARCGWEADSYYIEQWPFGVGSDEATKRRSDEGGTEPEAQARVSPPRRDGVRYPVKSASVSPDRSKVFLEIENLKQSHVVYIRLLPPCVSEDGDLPWSTEAWYTLNAIPEDRFGKVLTRPAREPQSFLTAEETAAGWELLFDGKTTDGWRGYKKDRFPDQGWRVIDDCLVRVGPGGGDICTVEQFDNFELRLEWRICAGGNSGIFYRVDEQYGWPWESGPEMQVLDNAEHADGRNPKTSAGSNYALHAPVRDVTEPVGFFNRVRIAANGPHIEYWFNGVKIVEYELESPEWEKLVAESKFKDMPHHGRVKKGHIVLQDHGDRVWYRNIKIRRLGGE